MSTSRPNLASYLLVFCVIFSSWTLLHAACPDDDGLQPVLEWTSLVEGLYYGVYQEAVAFDTALCICQHQLGTARLAVLSNYTHFQALSSQAAMLASADHFWLDSLRFSGAGDSHYIWADGCILTLTSSQWAAGQPAQEDLRLGLRTGQDARYFSTNSSSSLKPLCQSVSKPFKEKAVANMNWTFREGSAELFGFSQVRMNFYEARNACAELGNEVKLATLEEHFNDVTQYILNNRLMDEFWVDATRPNSTLDFLWSNGEAVNESFWAPTEPFNETFCRLRFRRYTERVWLTGKYHSDELLYFICQKQLPAPVKSTKKTLSEFEPGCNISTEMTSSREISSWATTTIESLLSIKATHVTDVETTTLLSWSTATASSLTSQAGNDVIGLTTSSLQQTHLPFIHSSSEASSYQDVILASDSSINLNAVTTLASSFQAEIQLSSRQSEVSVPTVPLTDYLTMPVTSLPNGALLETENILPLGPSGYKNLPISVPELSNIFNEQTSITSSQDATDSSFVITSSKFLTSALTSSPEVTSLEYVLSVEAPAKSTSSDITSTDPLTSLMTSLSLSSNITRFPTSEATPESHSETSSPNKANKNEASCCVCIKSAHDLDHSQQHDLDHSQQQKDVQAKIAIFQKSLNVEKGNLSATLRRKVSASDHRTSATAAGFVGVIFLLSLALTVIISDLPKLKKDFTNRYRI